MQSAIPHDDLVQTAPSCDVCIITFNNADTIGHLLTSLEHEPLSAVVRILDNASVDGTPEVIDALANASRGRILTELSDINIGFPAASNRLLRQCTSDVVALVNPDIEFTPGSLARLVYAAWADRTIGIASCRLMTRDGQPQREPARRRPQLRRLIVGHLIPHRLLTWVRATRRHPGGHHLFSDHDVECTSGALMVFRRDLLATVGYLDSSVFMYLEDIDFAARVSTAGYRIRYFGATYAWHDAGVSARGRESQLYALLPQVWLTYLRRYGRRHQRLSARPLLLMVAVIAVLKRLANGEAPRGEIRALWCVLNYRPAIKPIW